MTTLPGLNPVLLKMPVPASSEGGRGGESNHLFGNDHLDFKVTNKTTMAWLLNESSVIFILLYYCIDYI